MSIRSWSSVNRSSSVEPSLVQREPDAPRLASKTRPVSSFSRWSPGLFISHVVRDGLSNAVPNFRLNPKPLATLL